MCGNMMDIQSATAEIRRGIKRKQETTGQKIEVSYKQGSKTTKFVFKVSPFRLDTRAPLSDCRYAGHVYSDVTLTEMLHGKGSTWTILVALHAALSHALAGNFCGNKPHIV